MGRPDGLAVALLGGLRVSVRGRTIEPHAWTRRKARGLVCLLALAPGHRLHREQLMEALWAELGPDAAASNLRKNLHLARRVLSADASEAAELISSDGGALALPRDAWVDVEAFEAAASAARRAADPDAYETALELYTGELLPEDRYEEWVAHRAEELRAEFLALLEEQVALLESRGELDRAAAALRREIAGDPLAEEAHARLMRVEALAGRSREALEVYGRLEATLQEELGVEPSAETQRLREEIATARGLAPSLTVQLWERVGDLRMLAGDVDGAASAFAAALGTGEAAKSTRLHRKAAQAYLAAHDVERAEPHLAEAIATSGEDAGESARLRILQANASWERNELDRAATLAGEGVELAEAYGEPDDVAAAHEALAIVCHYRGVWREGLREEVERLAGLPEGEPQLARVFDIHHCIGQYHLYGDGLWEGVEGYARETLDHAERIGAVRAQAFAWCLLGESLLLQARFDEAAGCLERSGELHASFGTRSGALAWQRLAELLVSQGEPGSAAPFLRRASAIATVSPMARHLWGRIHATSAFGALERGDAQAAVRSVRAAATAAARYGDCPTCSALLHPMAAQAYAEMGDAEGARAHAGAAARVAAVFESSAWRAMAASAEGSLRLAEGDPAGAARRFGASADLFERAGQPYWSSRAASQQERAWGNAPGTVPP